MSQEKKGKEVYFFFCVECLVRNFIGQKLFARDSWWQKRQGGLMCREVGGVAFGFWLFHNVEQVSMGVICLGEARGWVQDAGRSNVITELGLPC